MSLVRSAVTVGYITMISRLLGFVRDMIIASKLGVGMYADVFFIAFKLPNFFRHLFAEGAFNASFVPLYAGILTEKGQQEAKEFAENVCGFLFFLLLFITILAQIFMPWMMFGLAPGFSKNPAQFELAVFLSRITFPYLLFMSLLALFSGILNTAEKFADAAITPTILNLTLIAAALFLTKYTSTPAHALSIGVTISGVLQLAWVMVATHKLGIKLKIKIPEFRPDVRLLLRRIVPGIVGAGVTQINLWIDTIIATLIPSAVSYLYYADRVSQFPLAVIGTAMGTAMLPMLSRQIRVGDQEAAVHTQNRAIETALLFSIPAALGVAIAAVPIISVLFEHGAFHRDATIATAKSLAVLAFGLPAFVMIKVCAPIFFAHGDTKTPVRFALISLVTNTCMSLIFINFLSYVGLSLATVLSSWINVFMLYSTLKKRGLFHTDAEFKYRVPRIFLSSAFMGAGLWGMCYLANDYLSMRMMIRMPTLGLIVILCVVVYFVMAHFFKVCNLKQALRRNKPSEASVS